MTMHPLWRNIGIGTAAALAVAAGAFAALRLHPLPTGTLADRLPTDAVLAYASSPDGAAEAEALLAAFAPSLGAPSAEPDVTAIAAVRAPDGSVGWITAATVDGRVRIHGSTPALAPLLEKQPGTATLASDRGFRSLTRGVSGPFAYLAYPHLPRDASPLASFLTLDGPAVAIADGATTRVRVPASPAPRRDDLPGTLLAELPAADLAVALPGWSSAVAAGPTLSADARLAFATLATSAAAAIGPGLSLSYDLSPLFEEPSFAQRGHAPDGRTVYAVEGTGRSPADVERVLREIHARFASSRGGATVKVSEAEGFTLRTMTVDAPGATSERTDGAWSILETSAGDERLVSAEDGQRFVLTNAPDALRLDGSGPSPLPSATWETARPVLEPLLPRWTAVGGEVGIALTGGPDYAEWSFRGFQGL